MRKKIELGRGQNSASFWPHSATRERENEFQPFDQLILSILARREQSFIQRAKENELIPKFIFLNALNHSFFFGVKFDEIN